MTSRKSILITVALGSLALIGAALYLQIVKQMAPCPLCIMQRYAFIAVALICLVAAFLPQQAAKTGAALGMLAALVGGSIASWHLWIKAHPGASCGIDPLETSLNKIFTAKLMPVLFEADGLCTADYAPILGGSIPQWSLAWFVLFACVLGWCAFRRAK
jgi:disulfide bond formation protein DsbB